MTFALFGSIVSVMWTLSELQLDLEKSVRIGGESVLV
jgi:hypothetical protein